MFKLFNLSKLFAHKPKRLIIESDSMASVIGYHERISRINPYQHVESECGPVKPMQLVANASAERKKYVSSGHVIFEVIQESQHKEGNLIIGEAY